MGTYHRIRKFIIILKLVGKYPLPAIIMPETVGIAHLPILVYAFAHLDIAETVGITHLSQNKDTGI